MTVSRVPGDIVRQIFARSDEASIDRHAVLIAALGMSAPVVVATLFGRTDIGFTIGLGAILLSGSSGAATSERRQPQAAVIAALLAVIIATLIAGKPWTDPTTIAFVSIVGLASGYSRPVGAAAIHFSIYLVLSAGVLNGATEGRHAAALILGLGAAWNIALRFLLHNNVPRPEVTSQSARALTSVQRRAYFRRTLNTPAGWQFPIRLAVGLALASLIRHLWPTHHFYWIMLTVALLTQRPVEHLHVKTLQRLIGTVAGVGITWIMLIGISSRVELAALVCLLGTLAPIARAQSYLLYSVVVTPLILLVLDLGKPLENSLLTDRLVATLIGGGIVVAMNIAVDFILSAKKVP